MIVQVLGSPKLRLGLKLFFVLELILGVGVGPYVHVAASETDFSGWLFPLPAGEWVISRGPCGSTAQRNHRCQNYEEQCALDIMPATGSMENTPVLAPLDGQVFFVGRRTNRGITVMLQHDDGRASAFMHLSQAVVGSDQLVKQGEVIGYAGHTGTDSAHLHFYIQPNVVQRACIMPDGLDAINYEAMQVVSHNLTWEQLVLINPPNALLERLPVIKISKLNSTIPLRMALTPDFRIRFPVLLTGELSNITQMGVSLGGIETLMSSAVTRTVEGAFFRIPIKASFRSGPSTWTPATGPALADHVFTLTYTVTQPVNLTPANSVILTNPELISPTSYSYFSRSPSLCWRMPFSDGISPFAFRVVVAGPMIADSGWLYDLGVEACWRPPELSRGIYYWKVFVRDSKGFMNRTHQYPLAFVIR